MRASCSSVKRRTAPRSSIACASAFHASSSSARDLPSSPSRAIGRTQHVSIITFGMLSTPPPNGRRSRGFRSGCGATRRCEISSTGYAHAMQRSSPTSRVAFHGLDLYSLYNSIRSVLNYLDDVDPRTAQVARQRYGCLTPWQSDPATYGHAALTGAYQSCEREVVTTLLDLMEKRRAYAEHDGERFLDAVQNARLVANAERYYRIMYYGSRASWNLRDGHMFETLKTLLGFHGPKEQGHRLGPQFARGRLCGDRNGVARRIQHRPSVPPGIRRRGVLDRLRDQ